MGYRNFRKVTSHIRFLVKQTHQEFIKKLNDLKDEAESAREDYILCLENQKKAKMIWAILKSQILKLRNDYDKSKTTNNN